MREKMVLTCSVNGEQVSWDIFPEQNLLRVLRDHYVYDVKCGCEEGDCGACTVLLNGLAVKSCIILAASCEGAEIWTCKGLGDEDRLARRIQDAFVACGSVQCGFCTPGMIVCAVDYLKKGGKADRNEIRKAISGNLCRCTGYVKIVDAIYAVAKQLEEEALA